MTYMGLQSRWGCGLGTRGCSLCTWGCRLASRLLGEQGGTEGAVYARIERGLQPRAEPTATTRNLLRSRRRRGLISSRVRGLSRAAAATAAVTQVAAAAEAVLLGHRVPREGRERIARRCGPRRTTRCATSRQERRRRQSELRVTLAANLVRVRVRVRVRVGVRVSCTRC